MKKILFIFSLVISFGCSAQDSTQTRQLVLFDNLHRCFMDGWKIERIDPGKKLEKDSLFLPSGFLLRVYLFMTESTEPALVYFFDARPEDSVMYHYLKNIFATATMDTSETETPEEYESMNSNGEFLAFSFCPAEKICEVINTKFSNEMSMAMPKMELKLTEIKQEEKYIKPPPPPPPPPARPTKNKQKKKG